VEQVARKQAAAVQNAGERCFIVAVWLREMAQKRRLASRLHRMQQRVSLHHTACAMQKKCRKKYTDDF
jgi:hypothetical protein